MHDPSKSASPVNLATGAAVAIVSPGAIVPVVGAVTEPVFDTSDPPCDDPDDAVPEPEVAPGVGIELPWGHPR